jgi:ATP adenylyltransferase
MDLLTMLFEDLLRFIECDMRMSHVYQPVMLRALLMEGGKANRSSIARELLNEDRSQLEYYSEITRDMVGKVLANRGIVKREGQTYQLLGHESFTAEQIQQLTAACERKLAEYIERRGQAIWNHRRSSSGYVSGTLRYEVLKRAKFRCELCGVSAEERALEVDHIVPRHHGGRNEIINLQALCYSHNAMKRDKDNTDFRAVRAAYEHREINCPFCNIEGRTMIENRLALALRDAYPVTLGHALIVPRRHTHDYFDLGLPEVRACQLLLQEARQLLLRDDPSIQGFNVGINSGEVAGQTIGHAHIHLIPRRSGDVVNPRGGVRAAIPGAANY